MRLAALLVIALAACEAPPVVPGGDASASCRTDVDCQDDLFCDGAERCEPGAPGADQRGCLGPVRPPCDPTERCEEAADRCMPPCDVEPDADGDGARATACGGADCDDADPFRHPGAAEVCDVERRDEDCDPRTYGIVDGDDDGFPSMRCCNVDADGAAHCGSDCDDDRAGVHRAATEQCNGIDDDCDLATDEGVARTYHPDADGDGAGDGTAMPIAACGPPAGYVADDTDCDDGLAARRPGASEVCDGIDNDCDGVLDGPGEDVDGDGYASALCAGARGTDCDDGDASIHPGAAELCDRVDQDCSAGGAGEPGEDLDRDGHAPATASCSGGPFPRDDCDDGDPAARPAGAERCDGVDEDCDGTIDEGAASACAAPGATTSCRDGACVIDACDAGLASCDGRAVNGCEASLEGDVASCGACGRSCGTGARCVEGRCEELDLALGTSFACVRRASGSVACWGGNGAGELGTSGGARSTPGDVPGITDAVAVAASMRGACAARSGGGVRCWGFGRPAASPTVVDAIDVSGAPCALRAFGGVACWSPSAGVTPAATTRALPIDARQIAGFWSHACAVRRTGAVRCWGANHSGQLGLGSLLDASGDGEVVGIADAVHVATGVAHTCVARRDGRVACFGANESGQLGDGTRAGRSVPVPVPGIADALEVAAGHSHSCARRATGGVVCWGSNALGELGDGTTTERLAPVAVVGIADAVAIAAGDRFTCVRRRDASVACWGANDAGQLGRGTADAMPHPTPAPVGGLP